MPIHTNTRSLFLLAKEDRKDLVKEVEDCYKDIHTIAIWLDYEKETFTLLLANGGFVFNVPFTALPAIKKIKPNFQRVEIIDWGRTLVFGNYSIPSWEMAERFGVQFPGPAVEIPKEKPLTVEPISDLLPAV